MVTATDITCPRCHDIEYRANPIYPTFDVSAAEIIRLDLNAPLAAGNGDTIPVPIYPAHPQMQSSIYGIAQTADPLRSQGNEFAGQNVLAQPEHYESRGSTNAPPNNEEERGERTNGEDLQDRSNGLDADSASHQLNRDRERCSH